MKIKLILLSLTLFYLLILNNSIGQTYNAQIKLNEIDNTKIVSPWLFGLFIEYLEELLVGDLVYTAQEFKNRGFDHRQELMPYPDKWTFTNIDTNFRAYCMIENGGYNENGVYYCAIYMYDSLPKISLSQCVSLERDNYNFYVYVKSTNAQTLKFELRKIKDNSQVWESPSVVLNDKWQKISFKIPNLNIPNAIANIIITGPGKISLDEVSLVEEKAVANLRRCFYDKLKEVRFGILRYPGGCFADIARNFWEFGIGEIDKRKSPNIDWANYYQRFDFGLDEYFELCDSMDIEPQITVNFGERGPKEAAQLVEYCNGDTTTTFGKKRAENGHFQSYNVKIWEIGNEQYHPYVVGHTTAEKYAERSYLFIDFMRKADSTIIPILNCSTYDRDWTNKVVKHSKDDKAYYSLHYASGDGFSKDYINQCFDMFGCQTMMGIAIDSFTNFIKDANPNAINRQAITEWWPAWEEDYFSDTIKFLKLGETIWSAITYNHIIRNADKFLLANRTAFYGVFSIKYDSHGFRKAFLTPTGYLISEYWKHFSNSRFIKSDLNCNKFYYKNQYYETMANFLDVVAGIRNDTLILCVVNISLTDSASFRLFSNNIQDTNKKYRINENSLFTRIEIFDKDINAMNSADEPFRIIPNNSEEPFRQEIIVPPHSVSFFKFLLFDTNASIFDTSSSFIVYPNLISQKVNVKLKKFYKEPFYKVFNLSGEVVSSSLVPYGKSEFVLDFSSFPIGMYYILIYDNNKTETIKVIKIK